MNPRPLFTVSVGCSDCVFFVAKQCFLDKDPPTEERPCSWHSSGSYVDGDHETSAEPPVSLRDPS